MTFLIGIAAKLVGERFARAFVIFIGIALLLGIASVGRCSYDAMKAVQARQDAKAAEAYATSAGEAVNAVAAAAGREAALKDVVTEAAKDIANAEGSNEAIPPAARDAALAAACRLPAYAHHPACRALLEHDTVRLGEGD